MAISMASDFQSDTGCPEPSLRAIASGGFSHLHWCHQWNTDFLYSPSEIRQIGQWLREMKLSLLDLHGSAGREKCWWSQRDYERQAGVELVANRVRMTAELGGASVVMHVPLLSGDAQTSADFDQLRRSLDELAPLTRQCRVPLALENMPGDNFRLLRKVLAEYGPDVVGICYDSGHGNIGAREGLDHLETVKSRLAAVHLHDNDGTGDQHRPPFTGTVDWPRLTHILAASSYRGCPNLEVSIMSVAEPARATFVADARRAADRLTGMVAAAR